METDEERFKLEFLKLLNLAVREGLYNHRHFGDQQPSPEVRERSVVELLSRIEDNDYDSLDELDRRSLAASMDVASYAELDIKSMKVLHSRLKARLN
jgi:hypothetical protein